MSWVYDKANMMWRRDLNVRVIFSPLRGWIAVHSMKGRLAPDYDDAETAKAVADKMWPEYNGEAPAPTAGPDPDTVIYIWPPPKKK